MGGDDFWGEPIHSYSRAEAIADGVLVDMTEWASSSKGFLGGFTIPVAMTQALWATVNSIPERARHQDVRGRAHDVLFMASMAARRHREASTGRFEVLLDVDAGQKTLTLLLVVGPGDQGEPVATIGYPEDF